jgi:hypothetical protein
MDKITFRDLDTRNALGETGLELDVHVTWASAEKWTNMKAST